MPLAKPNIQSVLLAICRTVVTALGAASLALGLVASPAAAEDAGKLLKAPVAPIPPRSVPKT